MAIDYTGYDIAMPPDGFNRLGDQLGQNLTPKVVAVSAVTTGSRSSAASDGMATDGPGDGIGVPSTSVTSFASNAPVLRSFRGRVWIYSEDSFTQYLVRSEELHDADSWPRSGISSILEDNQVAPDGNTTAEKVTWSGGAGTGVYQQLAAEPTDVNTYFSTWAKPHASSTDAEYRQQVRANNGAVKATSVAAPMVDEWRRYRVSRDNTAGASSYQARHREATSNDVNPVLFWGANVTFADASRQHQRSYVASTTAAVVRAGDLSYWAAGTLSSKMRSEPWRFFFIPIWGEAGDDNSDTCFFGWDDASTPKTEVRWNGSTNKIDVINDAQATVVSSSALTFSQGDVIEVRLNPVLGTVEVVGATTGDGKVTGTAWAVATDWKLGWGNRPSDGSQPCAWVSEPELL